MGRLIAALVVASGALSAVQSFAHHSIAAMYRENESVSIQGEVSQLHFRNPHSIIHVIVKDRGGREMRYAVEWSAAGELEDQGVTSQTLKIGDVVVITGSPARNAAYRRIRMNTLRRPKDNYTYKSF